MIEAPFRALTGMRIIDISKEDDITISVQPSMIVFGKNAIRESRTRRMNPFRELLAMIENKLDPEYQG